MEQQSFDTKGKETQELQRLIGIADLILLEERVAEYLRKLPVISVFVAATVLATFYFFNLRHFFFAFSWGILLIAAGVLQLLMVRSTSQSAVENSAAMVVLVVFLWWVLLPVFGVGIFSDYLCVLILALLSSVPWGKSFFIIQSFLFSVLFVQTYFSAFPVLFFMAGFFTLLLGIRFSLYRQFAMHVRTACSFLAGFAERAQTGRVLLRLLLFEMIRCSGSFCGVILFEDGDGEFFDGSTVKSFQSSLAARGLREHFRANGQDYGVVSRADIDPTLHTLFSEWFSCHPARMIFVKTPCVLDGKDQEVHLFIPLTWFARIPGTRQMVRAVVGLAGIVRSWLQQVKVQFQSSDLLLKSQQAAREREDDLSEVIHVVNNITQEIALYSSRFDSGKEKDQGRVSHQESSSRIFQAARYLSCAVSDTRLIREFFRKEAVSQDEQIDVPGLLEEIVPYAEYHSYRKGKNFHFRSTVKEGTQILSVRREYLSAALRRLLRFFLEFQNNKSELDFHFTVSEQQEKVIFSFLGFPLQSSKEEKTLQKFLEALMKLLRPGVSFEMPVKKTDALRMLFPSYQLEYQNLYDSGSWALLVDDQIEITDFYSRIADALELQHYSAASVPEAEKILEEHGRPRIIITDIQLGERSGLEIVEMVRSIHGGELPIIIVSGNSDQVGEHFFKNQNTSALTKPVGKRLLFSEIQRMLGAGYEKE